MLNGQFDNCYGLRHFTMPDIDFSRCSKAIIYAPNGSMKSSLAQTFEDISKGMVTVDRIFHGEPTSYSIVYGGNHYNYTSTDGTNNLPPANEIYVIKTFSDSFEFTKETVSTLLADEATRNQYNAIMSQMNEDISQIEGKLHALTGLTKPKIKKCLIQDLGLTETADWTDIFEFLRQHIEEHAALPCLEDSKYNELFNDKTMAIYSKPAFSQSLEQYISQLYLLLADNPVLNETFTDSNAENLGKQLEKYNLFRAQHTIHLKDGETIIQSIEEWNAIVKEQLDKLYSAPELSSAFTNLKKILTANADAIRLRNIIVAHREIIPLFADISHFKLLVWLDCFFKLDASFESYYSRISQYSVQIRSIYDRASEQSERWKDVVGEFNRRFRVPFEVQIENKANFLLKDELPNLSFKYTRGDEQDDVATLKKPDLMKSLSTGEERALYLLYILFDLENIRQTATAGDGHFLIIADDIADSFDYKNKYAIIEYLNDLGNTQNIDLLILTHNFDFYRTVMLRLNIQRHNNYIAQRDNLGKVTITEFKYQKDFFKNVVISGIKTGDISDDNEKKLLIASIPFYRNLCEYSGEQDDYLKLTCYLHLKKDPINTKTASFSNLWNIINPFLQNVPFTGTDEDYYTAIIRIANSCISNVTDEVLLENKLVMAIATRLKAEEFLEQILLNNQQTCIDSQKNQTREWFEQAKPYLTDDQKNVIEDVNLITPESIHINSFMFEPLIDISDWSLKALYNKVINL